MPRERSWFLRHGGREDADMVFAELWANAEHNKEDE